MEENLDTSTEPPLSKAIQASIELSQGTMGLDLDKSSSAWISKQWQPMSRQIVNQRTEPPVPHEPECVWNYISIFQPASIK